MIIDWKKIAENIFSDLKKEVENLKNKPKIGIILVWNNSSSERYIKQKIKWAEFVWMDYKLERLDENTSEDKLIEIIKNFNNDETINWFIVQLPLPKHIDEKKILNIILPEKDIDWFNPVNQGKMLIWDKTWFIPCTPAWIMEIFKSEKINVEWKVVCVIWRSNIVWKPITSLLINAWATVISCNSKTKDLSKYTTQADIVVIAVWKPELLKVNMLKLWAVVIDVWFTVIDWKIHGDADTKPIDSLWNKITPVPGWVWALTVAMLIKNTLKSYILQKEK